MEDTPLIYTIKGNLPIADLEYKVEWQDADDYLKMVETYRYQGEVVRESAHVYSKRGMFAEPVAQSLN